MQGFPVTTESAFISYYDEHTQQVKFCVVPRARVQSAIDRALAIPVPPDASENADGQLTDEDARKLGGIAILCHTKAHPELLPRLQITTEAPMNWTPTKPATE
jgi:hypothetical protein